MGQAWSPAADEGPHCSGPAGQDTKALAEIQGDKDSESKGLRPRQTQTDSRGERRQDLERERRNPARAPGSHVPHRAWALSMPSVVVYFSFLLIMLFFSPTSSEIIFNRRPRAKAYLCTCEWICARRAGAPGRWTGAESHPLPPTQPASKCQTRGHGHSPLSPSWKHAAYEDALPGSCKEPQATLAHFTFFVASPLQPSPYVYGSCLSGLTKQ